jgi:hypothetical protein
MPRVASSDDQGFGKSKENAVAFSNSHSNGNSGWRGLDTGQVAATTVQSGPRKRLSPVAMITGGPVLGSSSESDDGQTRYTAPGKQLGNRRGISRFN